MCVCLSLSSVSEKQKATSQGERATTRAQGDFLFCFWVKHQSSVKNFVLLCIKVINFFLFDIGNKF